MDVARAPMYATDYAQSPALPPISVTAKIMHHQVQTHLIRDETGMMVTECSYSTGILVKPKWQGTHEDKVDMTTLGRHQVLRVQISALKRTILIFKLTLTPDRGILDSCRCWDLVAHSYVHGKSCSRAWRCCHFRRFYHSRSGSGIFCSSASTVAQQISFGATLWS